LWATLVVGGVWDRVCPHCHHLPLGVTTSSTPVRTAIRVDAPVGTSRRSGETRTGTWSPKIDVVWPSSAASVAWRERQPFDQATAVVKLGPPGTSSGGLTEGDRAVLAHWYFKVRRARLRLLLHLPNHPQPTHRPLQPGWPNVAHRSPSLLRAAFTMSLSPPNVRGIANQSLGGRQADSVFEIGLGDSTTIAVSVGVPRLTGVDDSLERVRDSVPCAGTP
jgi:hypothetical protein